MKKAVITLLGMISHTRLDYIIENNQVKRVLINIGKEDRAIYTFSENLNDFSTHLTQKRYINTLPLLIDVFKDRDIIPISTDRAKDVQEKTLQFLEIKSSALDNTILINESDYESIFQEISELLQSHKYDSFIIDLTHGFRHLPILMIVNLIIASMKDVDKIEHIFFAKEIIHTRQYEIIDLLDYIDLAKLSFVLENFNLNYTVGNKLFFRNEKYQDLVDSLRIISGHILANSLKTLIEKDNNLVCQTIEQLSTLKEEDKNISTFSASISNIIKHLHKIEILKNEQEYIKLFKFAQMMKEREYLLNSITLLNESIGMYCVKLISDISPEIESKILSFIENENFSLYKVAQQSKTLIYLENSFKGYYLDKQFSKNEILSVIKESKNNQLKLLIKKIGDLRNNLAHGNSSDKIENVKKAIDNLLKEYKGIIKMPNEIDIEERFRQIEKKSNQVKNRREKIIPKGINAPKEKINELTDFLNNR
jgi:CRISPR-associated DxTHG motif protein